MAMTNKVPAVTAGFWAIKILATTVGETGADFLASNLFGPIATGALMVAALAAALAAQMRAPAYVPWRYWLAVVLISVVGTLLTDALTDALDISLFVSTAVFAALLAATFAAWYAAERTLSIHTITTPRRERFYWLAILFTFALGTAAGDLAAEQLALGYALSAAMFAAAIGAVAAAYYGAGANAIAAFWVAYVLTRPLGASLGDLLSQPRDAGGLALGALATSAIFLAAILALVAAASRPRAQPA